MAYADQEGSIQDGAPYFLYQFTTTTDTYRFTDYPAIVEWNSLEWNPLPIKHSEAKQSNEISKNSLKVTIPIQGTFADLFLGWSPDAIISFTLRRGHFGSSDTLVYWKGRVSSHNLKNQVIELNCESIFTSMRRPGIRARFQRSCRHALYSEGCNVDKADFELIALATAQADLIITVPDASGEADGYYTGGAIQFPDGSYRLIKNHTGNAITLSRANRSILEGLDNSGYGYSYGNFYGGYYVRLYPGCDRTITTCLNTFDNLDNQGGFKWIPAKNPMGGSSIV